MEHTHASGSAAVLMMLLGADLAATVMRFLDEEEVVRISSEMSRVDGKQYEYIDRLEKMLDAFEAANDYPPIS